MFRGDLSGYGSGLVGARLVLPNYKPRKRLLENFVTLIANFSHTFRKIYVIYIYIYIFIHYFYNPRLNAILRVCGTKCQRERMPLRHHFEL